MKNKFYFEANVLFCTSNMAGVKTLCKQKFKWNLALQIFVLVNLYLSQNIFEDKFPVCQFEGNKIKEQKISRYQY